MHDVIILSNSTQLHANVARKVSTRFVSPALTCPTAPMHIRPCVAVPPRAAICRTARAVSHRNATPPNRPRRCIIRPPQGAPLSRTHTTRYDPRPPQRTFVTSALIASAVHAAPAALIVPIGLFVWSRHTAAPEGEYLVRPSEDWKNIKITKRGFVWPFQPCVASSFNSPERILIHSLHYARNNSNMATILTILIGFFFMQPLLPQAAAEGAVV